MSGTPVQFIYRDKTYVRVGVIADISEGRLALEEDYFIRLEYARGEHTFLPMRSFSVDLQKKVIDIVISVSQSATAHLHTDFNESIYKQL